MTLQPELESCEFLLEDGDEDQWRQIHPRFLDGDVVSREAFVGTSGASEEVSTTRSSTVTAEEAYRHHSENLKLRTGGSWPVAVDEVGKVGSRVVDDSGCDGVDTPGHSFLDLRGLSKVDRRRARTQLAAHATARGRSFP